MAEPQDLAALSEELLSLTDGCVDYISRPVPIRFLKRLADAISPLLKEAEGLKDEISEQLEQRKTLAFKVVAERKRAADLEAQLSAATKRAEAAEGALAKLVAAKDIVRGGWDYVTLEAAFDRARGLTREGAER